MRSQLKRAASEAGRVLAQLGAHKGGKASAAALSADERVERARAAGASRWAGKSTTPVDQAAVLSRLKEGGPVELRIAPGGGGRRRRTAIYTLASKGLITIIEVRPDAITAQRA